MPALDDVIGPGKTIGRYELLVPVAQGGMAAVWAARLRGTRGFSKTVAIKTMLPAVSGDPQYERMFLDEARIASRIRHPNVGEILDLGEHAGILYLVMEWIDGEPLSALRRAAGAEGIPIPIAVRIVQEACAGLHAAHELTDDDGCPLALVHRDISPQNVMVTFDGMVKVVDFGVLKVEKPAGEATGAGTVKGKPRYMSPEQALGRAIDRRTDLFAMGIMLYLLTTGRHPFRGTTELSTLRNIVAYRHIGPPSQHVPGYPEDLEQVVLRAVAKDPVDRFQTARELEKALDGVKLPRMHTDDVAAWANRLLGSRGEARRQQLREAVRIVDDRTNPSGVVELESLDDDESEALTQALQPSLLTEDEEEPGQNSLVPSIRSPSSAPAPVSDGRQLRVLGWLAGAGALLAAAAVALVLSRPAAAPPSGARPAGALPTPVEASAAVVADQLEGSPSPTPPAASASAAAPAPTDDALPVAAVGAPAAGPHRGGPSGVRPSPATPAEPVTPAESAAPPPRPKPVAPRPDTGFVPPPVTDPGF